MAASVPIAFNVQNAPCYPVCQYPQLHRQYSFDSSIVPRDRPPVHHRVDVVPLVSQRKGLTRAALVLIPPRRKHRKHITTCLGLVQEVLEVGKRVLFAIWAMIARSIANEKLTIVVEPTTFSAKFMFVVLAQTIGIDDDGKCLGFWEPIKPTRISGFGEDVTSEIPAHFYASGVYVCFQLL